MIEIQEVTFKSDTKHRKAWFTGLSFSHPAKMVLPLQLYLIDRYTKLGEVILDPMAGSGTLMVACSMGRHVITVELEQKFVDMQKGNWEKIKQRGPQLGCQMGTATILKGDARNLEGILADTIISSPPYAATQDLARNQEGASVTSKRNSSYKAMPAYYTGVDTIMGSPPYEGTEARDRSTDASYREDREKTHAGGSVKIMQGYQAAAGNIGNLKGANYLQAMYLVYQQCYAVLKPQGLMILVVKNFLRAKAIVRLDSDTVRLCEQAGFTLKERFARKLTTQSFWRNNYRKKYPDAPEITREDILVFEK